MDIIRVERSIMPLRGGSVGVSGVPNDSRQQSPASAQTPSDPTAVPLAQSNDSELIKALGMDEAVKRYAVPKWLPAYNTSATLLSGSTATLLDGNGLYGAGESAIKSRYQGLDRLSEPEQQKFNRQVMQYYYSAVEESGILSVGEYLDFIDTPGSRLHQRVEARLNEMIGEDDWMMQAIRTGSESV